MQFGQRRKWVQLERFRDQLKRAIRIANANEKQRLVDEHLGNFRAENCRDFETFRSLVVATLPHLDKSQSGVGND